MRKLIISLIIGIIAGIIDVLPMFAQHLAWNASLSAFLHWVCLGVIIAYIDFGIKGWLKGLILAEITAVPFVLIAGVDTALPIFGMSAILGILVGFFSDKYTKI
jgi:hypothetical protein